MFVSATQSAPSVCSYKTYFQENKIETKGFYSKANKLRSQGSRMGQRQTATLTVSGQSGKVEIRERKRGGKLQGQLKCRKVP